MSKVKIKKDIQEMIAVAGRTAQFVHKNAFELCSIVNAKSGLCAENGAFCSQSMELTSPMKRYPLLSPRKIVTKAKEAVERGVLEFCVVTSRHQLTAQEFKQLLEIIAVVRREVTIHLDVSVGFLEDSQARLLKVAGVSRVNDNVQISNVFYDQIVATHSHRDRIKPLIAAKEAGLEIYSGVILGVGERREDRVQAAFEIKAFEPACVPPVNLPDPRPGTPLASQPLIDPAEILKSIAVFRLILPRTCLKLAGVAIRDSGDLFKTCIASRN